MDIRNWFTPITLNETSQTQEIIITKNNQVATTTTTTITNEIEIYTDGSCFNNGKKNVPGGIGVYIPILTVAISEKIYNATNNIAELKAIIKAIDIIKKHSDKRFIIYTDSQYSINCCTQWVKKWIWDAYKKVYKKKSRNKTVDVKNSQLIREIVDYLSNNNNNMRFKYIKAHTSKRDKHSVGNDMADQLAKKGILGQN